MRAAMRIGIMVMAVLFAGGELFADGGGEKKDEKKEEQKDEKEGEKKEEKKKLTKEEKKEQKEKEKEEKEERAKKMKLAKFGKKVFDQSTQYSTVNKGCGGCHIPGGEKDLTGKVTDETDAAAREAIKKCVEERMKASEDKAKLEAWNKNPHNVDALVEYLKMLKPRGK